MRILSIRLGYDFILCYVVSKFVYYDVDLDRLFLDFVRKLIFDYDRLGKLELLGNGLFKDYIFSR